MTGRMSRLLAVLLALSLLACTPEPNESEVYLSQITVDGYELVRTLHGQSESAAFVGPRQDYAATIAAVQGPGLTLSRDQDLIDIRRYIAHGFGYSEATGECFVRVSDIGSAESVKIIIGEKNLNDSQWQGLIDGTLAALEIGVVCEAQADR